MAKCSELPKYLILDGGLSTELVFTHGYKDIDGDPLWSARLISSNPSAIQQVHESFLQSGSDAIETATYQASVPGFMQHLGLSEKDSLALIQKGAELACQSRNAFWQNHLQQGRMHPLVVGSLGPYGVYLADGSEYTGSYISAVSDAELIKFHHPRISALIDGGVDLIAFDTIPVQREAVLVAQLLRTEFPSSRAWMAFSCKDSQNISSGELFSDAVESLLEFEQIIGVGINCTPPEYVEVLLKSLSPSVQQKKAVVVYPNSGEVWTQDKRWLCEGEMKPLSDYVPAWMDAGATWIGGCCRTGPKDIALIRATMLAKLDNICRHGRQVGRRTGHRGVLCE